MNVLLRPAEERDLAAVADLWVRSWLVGYAGVVPRAALDAQDLSVRHGQLVASAADPSHRTETLVADEHGAVVGFAVVGPWRGADGGAGIGELMALRPDPVGTRGRALTGAALARPARRRRPADLRDRRRRAAGRALRPAHRLACRHGRRRCAPGPAG